MRRQRRCGHAECSQATALQVGRPHAEVPTPPCRVFVPPTSAFQRACRCVAASGPGDYNRHMSPPPRAPACDRRARRNLPCWLYCRVPSATAPCTIAMSHHTPESSPSFVSGALAGNSHSCAVYCGCEQLDCLAQLLSWRVRRMLLVAPAVLVDLLHACVSAHS